MKILVLGGSGTIGTGIVNASVSHGHEVFALTRGIKEMQNNDKINYIKCDWSDEKAANEVLENKQFDVIVDGLVFTEKQLIRDLERCRNHCKQYIYISTAGVYEQPAVNCNEGSPKRLEKLTWGYSFNKRKAEIYIENNRNNYDFMITTVRPAFTYGNTRVPVAVVSRVNQWTLIDRILKNEPIVFIDDGNNKHAITHISTFSEGVVSLFMRKEADGEMYHITDDNAYTWEEVIETVGRLLKVKPIVVHLPINSIKYLNNSLYQEIKYNKMVELSLDNSKIKKIAPNVNYSVPLEEGLSKTIEHLREVYSIKHIDENFNDVCDKALIDNRNLIKSDEIKIVENYISTISSDRKKKLQLLKIKRIITYYLCTIYSVLRKIIGTLFRRR